MTSHQKMSKEICRNCKYWKQVKDSPYDEADGVEGFGHCYRYPKPKGEFDRLLDSKNETDWCGEFAKKEDKTDTEDLEQFLVQAFAKEKERILKEIEKWAVENSWTTGDFVDSKHPRVVSLEQFLAQVLEKVSFGKMISHPKMPKEIQEEKKARIKEAIETGKLIGQGEMIANSIQAIQKAKEKNEKENTK